MVSPTTTTTTTKSSLPAGEYNIVAWDLDTTGRRLIDEICQIAAYCPENNFSQYVMPYRDLDLLSKRRHLIRTVTVGRYRMLKDIKTGKILKTKSDITALHDFLAWLEKIKGDGPAILLLHYETFKLVPFLLLQALAKYNLMDKFSSMVKGFADCYSLVKQRCESTLKSFSLRTVSKVLLDKEGETFNAGQRSQLAYQVVQHLTAGEGAGDGDSSGTRAMVNALLEHSSTIAEELDALEKLKVLLQRQNSLFPIFQRNYSRANISAKKNSAALRRLLAHAVFDYDTLKALWDKNKKEALEAGVKEKLPDASEEQYTSIIKTLVEHFDPDVKPTIPEKKPVTRGRGRYNRRNTKVRTSPKTSNGQSASSEEATPTASSPSKSNGGDSPKMEESPKHEPKAADEPPKQPKAEDCPRQRKTEEQPPRQPKAEEPPKQPKAEEPPKQPKAEESPKQLKAEVSQKQPKAEDSPKQPKAESPKSQPKAEVSPKSQNKAESSKSPPKSAESPKNQPKAVESPKPQRKAEAPLKTSPKAGESAKNQSLPASPTRVNNTSTSVSPEKK